LNRFKRAHQPETDDEQSGPSEMVPFKMRDPAYIDFSQPTFRSRLMAAAREYDARVFGESSGEKFN
jgi:hypothetical protein